MKNILGTTKPMSKFVVLASIACTAAVASADLTLTAAGVSNGLHLSTFASGFPFTQGVGPIAMDFQPDGTVLVSSWADIELVRFNTANNQTYAGASATNYPTTEFAIGLTHLGATEYASRYTSKTIVKLNPNGSINSTVASNIGNVRDIKADPATGLIYASTLQGLRAVNPNTGNFVTVTSQEMDGIVLSTSDLTVYGAARSGPLDEHVVGYNRNYTTTSTGGFPGWLVFDSGFIGGGVDGVALGSHQFAGFIFVNCNNGTLVAIRILADREGRHQQILLATGGSRGDYMIADPSGNGDMLITQTDRILRLSLVAPPSCPGDFDMSGGTPDASDIDVFFNAWLAGDASADIDNSGGTPDASDIDDFFIHWLAGC